MIGSAVGPYQVIGRLGTGGMGEVFLGHDTRLHRKVALKCLTHLPSDGTAVRDRVLGEARTAARLNHPHIAGVYDVIEQEGRAYIVMEYVAGESLAARLSRGRLAIDEVVTLGTQLASAVAAAHEHRVIHRDLKPANIHFTPDGSVKVLDFGVAKLTPDAGSPSGDTDTGALTLTIDGNPGTPSYMSPEQLLNQPIDARTDVYSLGLILFEMAVGRRPYPERDMIGLAMAVAAGPAPRAESVNPEVPHALGAIIAKAIEREPENRYTSAHDLEQALISMTAPEPAAGLVRAAPGETASSPHTARRVAVALASALFVPAVLGVANSAAFNIVLQRPAPFNQESWQAYFVWGLRSLVAPVVYMSMATALVLALMFVARVVRLLPPVDRALATTATRTQQAGARLGFDDPVVRLQALAALGLAAIAAVAWWYQDLIQASVGRISDAPPSVFAPLRPENFTYKDSYGIVLDVLTLAFAFAVYRIGQVGAGRRARLAGPLAMAAGVLLVFVLMNELPYRVMWQNDFERIQLDGSRCYVIGEQDAEWLVYCPDNRPPRNRIVPRESPDAVRTGIVESIFTQPGP